MVLVMRSPVTNFVHSMYFWLEWKIFGGPGKCVDTVHHVWLYTYQYRYVHWTHTVSHAVHIWFKSPKSDDFLGYIFNANNFTMETRCFEALFQLFIRLLKCREQPENSAELLFRLHIELALLLFPVHENLMCVFILNIHSNPSSCAMVNNVCSLFNKQFSFRQELLPKTDFH